MQLNILRNMNVGLKNKKKAVGNVIDPREGWKCPLCSTPHKSDTQPLRPYLSVCPIFIESNVDGRYKACTKHNYCKVCLCSADTKSHKENKGSCPKSERFRCKNCPAPQCFTHCDMLCFASQKPPVRSTRGRGRGGGQGRGRGG